MRYTKIFIATCTMVLFLAVGTTTAENATKVECVAKVKEAATLAGSNGVETILAQINAKDKNFVWKDSYIFALHAENATVIAHPMKPKLVGKMLTGMKDINGKMFFAEFITVANEKGEGWVDYMWPKVGEKKPSPKITYVYKVPDQPVIFAAGIHN